MKPEQPPIGRHLHWVARAIQKGFDEALEEAGGTQPVWLILLTVKVKKYDSQRELAKAVRLEEPTLTHHLDAMERDGLVTRERDPDNRRAIRVELTSKGEEMFTRLRDAATAYDRRMRRGISADDIDLVRETLTRMAENVTPDGERAG